MLNSPWPPSAPSIRDLDLSARKCTVRKIAVPPQSLRTSRSPSKAENTLDAAVLARQLGASGIDIEVVASTASTNSDLLARARAGALLRPVLRAAHTQTAGRGQRGRGWHASPGSALLFSLALPWQLDPLTTPAVTLACGLAAAKCLRRHDVPVAVKWPNDILLHGNKLAGILTEVAQSENGASTLVIGMGLNLRPDARVRTVVGRAVADLAQCLGEEVAQMRELWLARLAAALLAAARDYQAQGFAGLREAYNALLAYRGQPVQLRGADGLAHSGLALGVDDTGRLLLDCAGSRLAIASGELSLRPEPGDPQVEAA